MADSVEILKEKLKLKEQEVEYLKLLAQFQSDVIRETIPLYEVYERSVKRGNKKVMIKHELFWPYNGAMVELIEFNKDAEIKGRERGLEQVKRAKEDFENSLKQI